MAELLTATLICKSQFEADHVEEMCKSMSLSFEREDTSDATVFTLVAPLEAINTIRKMRDALPTQC